MLIVQVGKQFVRSVVAAALIVGVAACGSDDPQAGSDPIESLATAPEGTEPVAAEPAPVDTSAPPSEAPTESVAADAATRTVEHELGTSEVPVDPQRIVVVDRRGTLAFLLELGIEPVGALEAAWLFGDPFHPMVMDAAVSAGVAPIDGTDGPNLEQIAALQPDLIIGNVRDMAETEAELAQIAPTIGLAWNFADPLANAVTIGAAVDRSEEAQTLVDDFDAALEAAASDTTDPGDVSIIGLFAPDDIRIYRSANLFARLTEALGGVMVPSEAELALDPEDDEVNFVSLEEIGLAGGSRLISFVNVAPEADSAYRSLESEAIVQALPGFQSGLVLEADPQLAFGAAGATGINAMLTQLVEFYDS